MWDYQNYHHYNFNYSNYRIYPAVYNIKHPDWIKSKLELQQSSRMWSWSVKTVATEKRQPLLPQKTAGLKPRLHLKSYGESWVWAAATFTWKIWLGRAEAVCKPKGSCNENSTTLHKTEEHVSLIRFPYSGTIYLDERVFAQLRSKHWLCLSCKSQGCKKRSVYTDGIFKIFMKGGAIVNYLKPYKSFGK